MIKKLIFSLLCSSLVIITTAIWAGETIYSEPGEVIAAVEGNHCNKHVPGDNSKKAPITAAVCNITLYNSFFELCSLDKNINTSSCTSFAVVNSGVLGGAHDDEGSHNSYGGGQLGSASTSAEGSLQDQEPDQEQYLPPTTSYVAPKSSSTKKNNKLGTWF